jgi:hypothetical protein
MALWLSGWLGGEGLGGSPPPWSAQRNSMSAWSLTASRIASLSHCLSAAVRGRVPMPSATALLVMSLASAGEPMNSKCIGSLKLPRYRPPQYQP